MTPTRQFTDFSGTTGTFSEEGDSETGKPLLTRLLADFDSKLLTLMVRFYVTNVNKFVFINKKTLKLTHAVKAVMLVIIEFKSGLMCSFKGGTSILQVLLSARKKVLVTLLNCVVRAMAFSSSFFLFE